MRFRVNCIGNDSLGRLQNKGAIPVLALTVIGSPWEHLHGTYSHTAALWGILDVFSSKACTLLFTPCHTASPCCHVTFSPLWALIFTQCGRRKEGKWMTLTLVWKEVFIFSTLKVWQLTWAQVELICFPDGWADKWDYWLKLFSWPVVWLRLGYLDTVDQIMMHSLSFLKGEETRGLSCLDRYGQQNTDSWSERDRKRWVGFKKEERSDWQRLCNPAITQMYEAWINLESLQSESSPETRHKEVFFFFIYMYKKRWKWMWHCLLVCHLMPENLSLAQCTLLIFVHIFSPLLHSKNCSLVKIQTEVVRKMNEEWTKMEGVDYFNGLLLEQQRGFRDKAMVHF